MNIGRMTKRVTLMQPSEGGFGEAAAFTAVRTVWASVEPVNGREFLAQHGIADETVVRFYLRPNEVQPKWRIVHAGKVYDVRHVIDRREAGEIMEVLAVVGASNG